MNIDVSQFHQTYLAEATEHLSELENGLLEIEKNGAGDLDAIFRAAHSIKGGAGTFGFEAIANFTHDVEEVLDKARDGDLELDKELTSLLLKCVDILDGMIEAAKAGDDISEDYGQELTQQLRAYLGRAGTEKSAADEASPTGGGGERAIEISFRPEAHLLKTGSDPLNIFRELASLGRLTTRVDRSKLPEDLAKYNPEDIYYSWQLTLETDVPQADVEDVFLFVSDDAEITYTEKGQMAQEEEKDDEVELTPAQEQRTGEDRRKGERRQGQKKSAQGGQGAMFMRVATDKVDELINLAGELVTTGAMVDQYAKNVDRDKHENLHRVVTDMAHHTRNMQQAVMAIRMMPMSFVFNRFPRMVRDNAAAMGKNIELVTEGEGTELDKTVIERMADPLTHLVRNAIDHGIETPEERAETHKPDTATVNLAARYQGGNVLIEVKDDGRGLSRDKILSKALERGVIQSAENMSDEEIWQLIFEPGFSTAETVTDVSGRGVGMDVVRRNIHSLGGSIRIDSTPGEGSVFTVSLPLTLAILDGMAIAAMGNTYIIPILSIIESTRPSHETIKTLRNNIEVMDFRGAYLPFIRLSDVFGLGEQTPLEEGIAIIVESENQQFALFVDDLLGERQVVIKSIEKHYKAIEGVSGATILGDGTVSFILDLAGLMRRAIREGLFEKKAQSTYAAAEAAASKNTNNQNLNNEGTQAHA